MGSKKRIALKPHIERIREWTDEGKTDGWIASALGTSASSVQSFRSRHDIRRGEGSGSARGPRSTFEAVLDHGEREGWGLRLDTSVSEDPAWRERWAKVESLVVKVAAGSIVLEPEPSASPKGAEDAGGVAVPVESGRQRQATGNGAAGASLAERGGSSGSTRTRATASWRGPLARTSSCIARRSKVAPPSWSPAEWSSTR